MKKHLMYAILTTLLCLAMVFGLAACGGENETTAADDGTTTAAPDGDDSSAPDDGGSNTPHEHTYAEVWSHDETHHWHAASCEHNEEKSDYAEHAWDEGVVTTPATCSNVGILTYTCACGATKTDEIPQLTEHSYAEDWAYDETHHWHASICEHAEEKIDYAEHVWEDSRVTSPATCSNVGVLTFFCACGGTKNVEIAQLTEHTYAEGWSKDETYHWHAATCGHSNEKSDYDSHTWNGMVTTPATCSSGVWTDFCICGATKTEEIPPATGHTYTAEWSKNITHHWHKATCEHYDEKSEYEEHIWGAPVTTKPATCFNEGSMTYTCKCGEQKTVPTSIVDHTYSAEWSTDGTHHWHAATCGHSDAKNNFAVHSYGIDHICTVCACPVVPTDGLEYTLNSDGQSYTVTGLGTATENGIVIAAVYQELPVTCIGAEAFSNCTKLKYITIPNTITTIGYSAFDNCTSLKDISIPDSVTSIGNGAFFECTNLTYTTFDNAKYLGNENNPYLVLIKFTDISSIESCTIHEKTKFIHKYAFSGCLNLTSITIPAGIISIDDSAFNGCSNLTGVHIFDIAAWCNISFADHSSNPLWYAANLYLNDALVTDLVVPDSVASIGDYAFCGFARLTSITIPDSVTSIGNHAFENCTGLTDVTIGDGVTSIGNRAFYCCTSLTDVTIGDGVTSIGDDAFYQCIGLISITLPDNVTSIGRYAFSGCNKLVEIYNCSTLEITKGSESLGYVGYYARNIYTPESGESRLHTTEDGYVFYVDETNCYLVGYHGSETNLTLPANYAGQGYEIDRYAFCNLANLTSITIPDSVTSIGNGAFGGCTNLTDVTLGDSVTSIGESAFSVCTSLTSITIPDSVTSIGYYAFSVCTSLTSITIPDSVTNIGGAAFYDCTSLASITISDSVKTIGSDAFKYCLNLTSVYISDIISWCNISFANHSSNPLCYAYNLYLNDVLVTDLVIPNGITKIGKYAFYGCTSIKSITLPEGLTSIGDGAFSYCEQLVEVYNCSALEITKGSFDFGKVGYYALNIYTPTSGESKIHTTENGYVFYVDETSCYLVGYCGNETHLILPANYAGQGYEIYQSAFRNLANLTSITIPDGVTSIGSSAFSGCPNLTSVTIGNSVTSIGGFAFYECTSLTSVIIGNGVTNIGDDAFCKCTSLTSITIPFVGANKGGTENTHFGYLFGASSSFYNGTYVPTSLQTVVITGGENIGELAFSGCSSLTSIIIPDSVTSIGNGAFGACTSLTSVIIGNGVTSIGSSAFSGCTGLTNITIPDSVTSIGNYAFRDCTSLTSITIPDSVTSIGYYAFSNCTSLTSITIPFVGASKDDTENTYFGYLFGASSSFNNGTYIPTSLQMVVITGGETIGSSAFSGCTGLTSITIPDSVTSIGDGAFTSCEGLTSIEIPDGVTSIGEYAFSSCESLTSIAIPNSVTSIGDSAFYGCTSLTSVYISDISAWCNIAFEDSSSNPLSNACNLYLNNILVTDLVIPNGLTSIGKYAFNGCTSLVSITIPDSVTSIGSSAFSGCTGLTSIAIPNSVTSIGEYAFFCCDSLTAVYYTGTPTEWDTITIDSIDLWGNFFLTSATRYYYSETAPTDTENLYWHYVEGVPTAW